VAPAHQRISRSRPADYLVRATYRVLIRKPSLKR
jgi:hypothetical protein